MNVYFFPKQKTNDIINKHRKDIDGKEDKLRKQFFVDLFTYSYKNTQRCTRK